jgi:hypothetical protein
VCHFQFTPAPGFKRCHVFHIFVRRSVLYVHVTIDCFSPKFGGKGPCMQHATCHLFQRPVLPLSYLGLLWSVWNCVLQLNTTSSQRCCTSLFTYSPPLFVWRILIIFPNCFSTCALKSLRCSNKQSRRERRPSIPYLFQISLADACQEHILDKLHQKIVCPTSLSPSPVC